MRSPRHTPTCPHFSTHSLARARSPFSLFTFLGFSPSQSTHLDDACSTTLQAKLAQLPLTVESVWLRGEELSVESPNPVQSSARGPAEVIVIDDDDEKEEVGEGGGEYATRHEGERPGKRARTGGQAAGMAAEAIEVEEAAAAADSAAMAAATMEVEEAAAEMEDAAVGDVTTLLPQMLPLGTHVS